MVVKTAEIFVFWVCGTPSNPTGARMYALPLSSKLLKDHPIIKCLSSANFIIVDETTPLPEAQRLEFCTVLVHADPAVSLSGKIPIIYSGFFSNLVREKLQKKPSRTTRIELGKHKLLKIRNKSISKIDTKAVRVISKLLTPGEHLCTVTEEDEDGVEVKDTLLNFSIDRKCFALCEIILKTKVNVNDDLCTEMGYRSALTRAPSIALHRARTAEVAELLLACGARVNAKNEMDETPLHAAVMNNQHRVVRVLLENNADINALFKTECKIFNIIRNIDKWPSPFSNAVAVAASLDTLTIFEFLIKFGATLEFEDVLRIPSFETRLSEEELFEKLERFYDFTFADFKHTDGYTVLVQERMKWYLNNKELQDFEINNLEVVGVKIALRIAPEIVRVEAAYDSRGPKIPDEIFNYLGLKEFKERCKKEVELLKRNNVPGTSTPLYDILTGDPSFVSRFFRDKSVAAALSKDTLYADFPIYDGALRSRVSRGSWRRQVLNDGMKLCCALFPLFNTLPWSVRESIVNLLTNQEILVVEACFSRKQLNAIVGIPNCQILLDKLAVECDCGIPNCQI